LWYYIVPFVLALALLAGREIMLRWRLLKTDMAQVEFTRKAMPGDEDRRDIHRR
jgi:hypothetical protein